jgi:hypothetical protein
MATFLCAVFLIVVVLPAWVASVVANVKDGTPGGIALALALPLIAAVAGGLCSALWSLARGHHWP